MYDAWKCASPEGVEAPPAGETCDCGSPLEGGEHGLCTDCVREAREWACDMAELREWGGS